MKNRDRTSTILPKKRSRSIAEWVAGKSWWMLILIGMLLYAAPVIVFTIIECCSPEALVVDDRGKRADAVDLAYFNFITLLTVGYGDWRPAGLGRLLSILEAVYGVGMFGLFLTAVATKLLSPRPNSLVFSKYAYYCTEQEMFLIIFVNTTSSVMVNVDMSWYFKLGGNWAVSRPIRAPFITTSVQTFFIGHVPVNEIISRFQKRDVLRIGISASLGFASYSASMEYHADEIIILPNRDVLTAFKGFWAPDFREEIGTTFHYRPDTAPTLEEYVDSVR